jgi:hypothetical protein
MLSIFKGKGRIEGFWAWFVKNKDRFEHQDEKEVLDILYKKISRIKSGLSVEVSGKFEDSRDLVISAEGDRLNFPIVQEIVNAAPEIPGWTITAFRQPSQIDFTLTYRDIEFSVSEMYFCPVIQGDFLDLIIYVKGIRNHDPNLVAHYGLVTMDHVLGEYACVMKVRHYDFHDLDDEKDIADLLPLKAVGEYVHKFHQEKTG